MELAASASEAPAPRSRRLAPPAACAALACAVLACLALAAPARAAVAHTVQPGETLSGIAAANGIDAATLAAWNGLDPAGLLIAGTTINVPSAAETGVDPAAATATTDPATGTATTAPAEPAPPAPGLATIPSPWGDLYLEAGAAQAWNAMRQASLAQFGQDLYPAGPVSAYRTSTQQGDLYESFLAGVGSPANPPGSSSHELGLSVDLATPAMRSIVDQIGAAYGWGKYEAPDEWWHVSYAGG